MIKRLFVAALAACASIAFGATTIPVSMLNPTGSSAGQVAASTGPSSPPAWTTVTLSGLPGTVAVASGGTGATTAAAARTNLGLGTAATASTGTSGATVPLLSGANTWSGAQAFSAAITPSSTAGIVGTTTNNNANAGSVGEFVPNTTAGTSLTSATAANCTSANLTAGDWDVTGTVTFTPAASTTVSNLLVGVSTTSATIGAAGTSVSMTAGWSTGIVETLSAPMVRVPLGSTTTVYLIGRAIFGVSTMTCDGTIFARRRR